MRLDESFFNFFCDRWGTYICMQRRNLFKQFFSKVSSVLNRALRIGSRIVKSNEPENKMNCHSVLEFIIDIKGGNLVYTKTN